MDKVRDKAVPDKMATPEIVPPEPHSVGTDVRKAWTFVPRWLRVVLLLIFIAGGVLILIFVKE